VCRGNRQFSLYCHDRCRVDKLSMLSVLSGKGAILLNSAILTRGDSVTERSAHSRICSIFSAAKQTPTLTTRCQRQPRLFRQKRFSKKRKSKTQPGDKSAFNFNYIFLLFPNLLSFTPFGAQRARSYLPVIRRRGLRFSSPPRWHR
jgi:hypothetical protein